MTKRLMLSLAQISTHPNEPKQNLLKTEEYIQKAKGQGSDMILFPELWMTGFNRDYLHTYKHEHVHTKQAVADLASLYSMWVCGSFPLVDHHEKIINASLLFNPEGKEVAFYQKIHLFSPNIEEQHMNHGSSLTLFEHSWGKSGFAICYDLRFPELFRSYALQGAQLIFLVAAFPHPRVEHWMTLIKARAIENQLYMVCVNRVGREEFQKGTQTFFGHSVVVNPWGEIILLGHHEEEMLLTTEIDLSLVDTIRQDIPIFNDRKPNIYLL
jgi:omega-amidase